MDGHSFKLHRDERKAASHSHAPSNFAFTRVMVIMRTKDNLIGLQQISFFDKEFPQNLDAIPTSRRTTSAFYLRKVTFSFKKWC
jgi:hypothetical protein